MQVNFTNHCKKRKSLASPSSFFKYYIELDFLGHSVRMTVSADLAQLVEQRTRNARSQVRNLQSAWSEVLR